MEGPLTVDGGVALALTLAYQGLDELGRLELDLAHGVLSVELPELVAHVEHVDAALLDAGTLGGDFADLQEGCGATGDLGRADAEEAAGVVWGSLGDVVEARCGAAVHADELGEVGEEARGLVGLDLAVLDWSSAEV